MYFQHTFNFIIYPFMNSLLKIDKTTKTKVLTWTKIKKRKEAKRRAENWRGESLVSETWVLVECVCRRETERERSVDNSKVPLYSDILPQRRNTRASRVGHARIPELAWPVLFPETILSDFHSEYFIALITVSLVVTCNPTPCELIDMKHGDTEAPMRSSLHDATP